VTYKRSRLPAVLQTAGVTAEDVLLETDSPWLPPVPHRGQRNEPSYLVHTRDRLAEVLGVGPSTLAATTTDSFTRLFGRAPGA
jgi:TatD DNase family protein